VNIEFIIVVVGKPILLDAVEVNMKKVFGKPADRVESMNRKLSMFTLISVITSPEVSSKMICVEIDVASFEDKARVILAILTLCLRIAYFVCWEVEYRAWHYFESNIYFKCLRLGYDGLSRLEGLDKS
jgi:hypothetical protein